MGTLESLLFDYDHQSRCDWDEEKEKPGINFFPTSLGNALRALVGAGADVNQRNAKGETPLNALMNGVEKYFLKKNEDIYFRS